MRRDKNVRRASVTMAVTLQRLMDDPSLWRSPEEELVLDALRRSTGSLKDASPEELAEYLGGLDEAQLRGVVSNVKGIYHELLFARAENLDGDEVSARLFEATNHPGADVEFVVDGETIGAVQLKAVSDPAAILEHLERYPDILIAATSEVAASEQGVQDTGLSNISLQEVVRDELSEAQNGPDGVAEEVLDGATVSVLAAVSIAAGKRLRGGKLTAMDARSTAEDVALGSVAALILDTVLGS